MARPPLEALLVLVLTAVRLAAASDSTNVERDALRAFRAGVSDPTGALRSWDTTAHFCRWAGVICTGGHVTSLSMESFGLTGTISPAVGNLTYLENLILNKNGLSGSIPASLGRARRLVTLDLCDNVKLTGEIPDSLRNCTGLIYIYLNNNGLTGAIPGWLGTFPNLTYLWLGDNSFTGEIPTSFGNLTKLESLRLQRNLLRGNLPDGLSRLPLLWELDVHQNHFRGAIPAGFFNMPSLVHIYLADNEFSGSLPPDAGTGMTKLQTLQLCGNRLTGPIPASLANASAMAFLALSDNSFTGRVPREIGTLCPIVLGMSNNELTATDGGGWEFLDGLTNCNRLLFLRLDGNSFTGRVPREIGALCPIKLEMSNNELTATDGGGGGGWEFLDGLTKCDKLQALKLDGNRLGGTMPSSIVNLSRNLRELRLGSNRISGSIPPGIGNLAALETLGLESNLLTGAIPEGIGKLKNLTELRLQENKLTGPVPLAVGDLTNLLTLVLSNNALSGSVPPTLGDLQKVALLNLSGNMLTGEVPRQLFRMASLSVAMDLSHNRLDGPIPPDVISLRNLAFLKLSGNRFSGDIPKQLGDCQSLEFLDLDSNFFTGDIPASLSMLKGLRRLNLTSNRLSGSIPPELGRMSGLQELYLSRNNLTGAVPEELASMSSLIELDLSYNQLAGNVPLRGVFANMTGFNIAGNGELCGGDPVLHLPQCPVTGQARRHARWWLLRIVVPNLSVALLFSATLLAIFLCYKRKSKPAQAAVISDVLDGGKNYQRISYGELAKATNGFADTNLIGEGKFGSVYLGILPLQVKGAPPEDVAVAVKVFNLRQVGASKTFLSECEALRSIRHRNLVSIVSCCSSIDARGEDFRALVFELMPNYSLDRWLHRKPESLEKFGGLSAVERLNIAVDIADALSYLHHGCVPPMVHCDLKPSNILLGEDMTAFIGDFGLAKLLLDDPGIHGAASSESTIGIRGTIGYVATEYSTTGKVSTYGDAYSFGITILEILSGRSPTDDVFTDGLTLHGLVAAAFPYKVEQVLDAALLPSTKAEPADGGACHGSEESGGARVTVHDCLVSAVRVGLSCARTVPYERMGMKDAAAELRAIRDALCSCLATAGSRVGADEDEDEAAAAV